MTPVLALLEELGRDAALAEDRDAYSQSVLALEIDEGLRAALLDRNRTQLVALMGLGASLCCVVVTPGEEEPGEPEGQPEEPEEPEEPGQAGPAGG